MLGCLDIQNILEIFQIYVFKFQNTSSGIHGSALWYLRTYAVDINFCFKSWFHPWKFYLTVLRLHFLICKVKIMKIPFSRLL